jgi:hypothetical protein
MRDKRIDQIADAIESHFPGTIVVIERCPSPDDPDIDWLLDVLNLPLERHRELTMFAMRLGDELFGEGGLPFLTGGVTPEWTALHYAKYLQGEPARP